MFVLISRGTLTTVPSESFIVTVPDEAAAGAAESVGVSSRQAPASRTRSRTSAATEAHGSDCAKDADAAASKDALISDASDANSARFLDLRIAVLGRVAHRTCALRTINTGSHNRVDAAQNVGCQLRHYV